MAYSVLNFITDALLDLGVLAVGEAPTDTEAQDALRRLNDLLETWNLQSLLIYSVDETTKVLTGATSYTIGLGGDINVARPVRIDKAAYRVTVGGTILDFPLEPLTDQQYESIALKSLTTTLPGWFYYDQAFPLGNIFLWPKATTADTLVLWFWHALSSFANLTATVTFPPGYARALRLNLAVELGISYRDAPVTDRLLSAAQESKGWLKTQNHTPRYLRLPGMLRGTSAGQGTDRAAFYGGWS